MTKKALISLLEPQGPNNEGYKVLEVLDANNTFETDSNFEWKDCPDNVEMHLYWWNPSTNLYKKLPEAVEKSTAGDLNIDEEGNHTEDYEWNWDTETWSKVQIL